MESDSYSKSGASAQPRRDIAHTLGKQRRSTWLIRYEALMVRFTPAERLILYILTALLALSTLMLLATVNLTLSESVPMRGGSLVEGETGPARFINPVLAISQADQDISALVYSGLMRATPQGTFIPDLASHYEISADGTVYTFTIRPDATFHDGSPVTAADVIGTIKLAQTPAIQSPHRGDWEGVIVSSTNENTIVFTLPHAYAPFIENATLGILPQHLWKSVAPEDFPFNPLNTHPVGSGAYKIASVQTDATGAPNRYDLKPFENFTLGAAHIAHISFVLFADKQALLRAYNAHTIDAIAGPSPEDIAQLSTASHAIIRVSLPRVFGIFYNQSKNPALTDLSVRTALSASIDRETIVHNVLGGFGTPLTGPIPPGVLGHSEASTPLPFVHIASATTTPDITLSQNARTILQKGGWTWDSTANQWTNKKKEVLSIALATADTPELAATARAVADMWRAAGVIVSVQVYPLSDFNNSILRPRNYDAVLFGEVVGRDADLFAFWHSKERSDPGLNLALYTNAKADTLLTQARSASRRESRDALYQEFVTLIDKEQPATFLYAPEFLYVLSSSVQGVEVGAVTGSYERFLNVYEWYINTEKVWSFFTNDIH